MIGRIIGNYQITSELAHGGMGVVYRGQHIHLPRDVVVKSILLGAFSASAQIHLKARFRREAFIQSQLDHPNIVRVFEFFAGEDNYYLVMEYVQGMTLRDLLARQGVPAPAQAVYLLKQALAALDYAHNFNYRDESDLNHSGIIHRDLKPANMLLDTNGRLKITDFGIVKVLGEQTPLAMTQSGFHPGTVEYMSPEQLLGLQIDGRSDIYSLGVTFYEMLTGRLPFERSSTGSDWDVRKGHIEIEPPSLLALRSDVHPALAAIMVRSLQKSPNERFQTAAEFLEAIKSYEQRYSVKEHSLQSPLVKSTQPQNAKPTIIDQTATLPAKVFQGGSSSAARLQNEDAETLPLTESVSPPADAKTTVPFADSRAAAAAAQAASQSRSRQALGLGAAGLGLLLAGTAAGAIFFSRQKPDPIVQTPATAATSPSPAHDSTPQAASGAPRPGSSPSAPKETKERSAYKNAQALEQSEQYSEAVKVYEDYLMRHPNAADAGVVAKRVDDLKRFQSLMVTAESAKNSRMYKEARRNYIEAIRMRPNSERARTGLAEVDEKIASRPMLQSGKQPYTRNSPGIEGRPLQQLKRPLRSRMMRRPTPTPKPPDSQ
jgi:serine/threonine protein kinase